MLIDTKKLRKFLDAEAAEEAKRLDEGIKDDRRAFAALTHSEQKFQRWYDALALVEECASRMDKSPTVRRKSVRRREPWKKP